jgi:hypothetical protein
MRRRGLAASRRQVKIDAKIAIFDEYARQHRAKADAANTNPAVSMNEYISCKQKAQRNQQYAFDCRAALSQQTGA